MRNFEGYELIYPHGCKEISENLKTDELRRRLTDIIKSLEETNNDKSINADYLLNNTEASTSENSNLKLEGLLMHCTSEMFIDHEDPDVQLRVAVLICSILKLYCPDNPFLTFGDSKNRINIVLVFLTKCLNEMTKLKSRNDKHFLNLYKIFSICCQTNLFHWFSIADDGENAFLKYIRTCFTIVKKFPDWSDDNKPLQQLSDSLVIVIGSHDLIIPDKMVSFVLNFLADRCATKEQKFLSTEIISRCTSKLEEQIQTILQSHLIKSEIEEDVSDSSDNEENDDVNDDFCSMGEYKMPKGKVGPKQEKSKQKPQKLEKKKNTIETCVEYSCDHTFQLIYELFKIGESIIIPLLPTVEMKLRSKNNVTDRKRACRLLGKLFDTYTPRISENQSSLWECFLGRFCDIEVKVREICVRVARDILRKAVAGDNMSGILAMSTVKEDLVKALQKRSHDQDETIRYQLVLSISKIFECSNSIIVDQELDFVNDMLFKILLDRTRDKCMTVRKETNASLGKLYRRILSDADYRSTANGNISVMLGLGFLLPGQATRLELLLTQILRLYVRVEVEDKIVVERLFNTYIVPYSLDSSSRMKALVQCFTICDDVSLMSIQELFKTQVMIMNIFRETVSLIRDSNSEVLSPSVSQKLKGKVKRLSEYLPNKDKVESLTKFFGLIRSEKKLFEIVSRLVNPDSHRDVIVKSISEIKRHLSDRHWKSAAEPSPAKKAFFSTVKCLLERSAPIIMDVESGQELISLLVSSNEAQESPKSTQDSTISTSRALKLLHVISIIYKNSIPTQEAYYYIASIISKFDISQSVSVQVDSELSEFVEDQQSTPRSTVSSKSLSSPVVATSNSIPTTIEELCLLTLARIVNFRSSPEASEDHEEDKDNACQDNSKVIGLFSDESKLLMGQTKELVHYLMNCATNGSSQSVVLSVPRSQNNEKTKDRRAFPLQPEDGDREHCAWRYNSRIAKLATRCLIGLYFCCQQESRVEPAAVQISDILAIVETQLDDLVKSCGECELFSVKQIIMLSTLSQLGLHLRRRFGDDIRKYVQDTVLLRILPEENQPESNDSKDTVAGSRNLSSWTANALMPISTQVKIQALKMLSKWMVTLKIDDNKNLISSVIACLRKFIGSYGNVDHKGNTTDGDMAQMRLAAGKCWLRLAQVQSFLSLFNVKWLHRLSHLIYDPCPQVRFGFLLKLHKGLFRLQLPLDYMAMFAFVPLVTASSDYLAAAKNYFAANVTRRREFLDRNPQYLTDAKLLFAVLPEYVLAFIIHMLAHDDQWLEIDNDLSIHRVKQCLWFVMEPILKLNENSSFIRKLLEKIKHAQDATEPHNTAINEKLYICCDIALGLLISKQATYDLKEYPVELKLPRTRYLPAPNSFFNPDFANILLDNPPRVLIQFSPTHKSKQMIMNFMPAPLIKGHSFQQLDGGGSNNALVAAALHPTKSTEDNSLERHPHKPTGPSKPKKHVAKIVVGLPEMESEGVSSCKKSDSSAVVARKPSAARRTPTKRKNVRSESPISTMEELESNPTSVTKRGRICKPNVRVMKDMIGQSRKSNFNVSPVAVISEVSPGAVRLEATVSINLERIQSLELSAIDRSAEESITTEINSQPKPPSPKKGIINKRKSINKEMALNTVAGDSLEIEAADEEKDGVESPPDAGGTSGKKKVVSPIAKSPLKRRTKKRIANVVHRRQPKIRQTPIKVAQASTGALRLSKRLSQTSDKFVKTAKIISTKAGVTIDNSVPSPKRGGNRSLSPPAAPLANSAVGRTTRSSQETVPSTTTMELSSNSVVLKELTKRVLTRKASSMRISGEKKKTFLLRDNNSLTTNIVPILETDSRNSRDESKKKNSSQPVNGSRLTTTTAAAAGGTPKSAGRPKKSSEFSPKSSPIEIVSRSKRFASQAATDQLVKKSRIV